MEGDQPWSTKCDVSNDSHFIFSSYYSFSSSFFIRVEFLVWQKAVFLLSVVVIQLGV